MERREFVKGVAATVAALQFIPEIAQGLTERLGKMASDLAGVTDDRLRWKRVRREFRLNPGLVHLNCGTVGASPGLVTAAVIAYMQELESDPLENMWGRSLGNQMEAVRAKAAEFLGAGTDEVVLTRNTTEGMNQVATGLDLKAGDEVLTTNHEHGGGRVCWQHMAKQHGVKLVYMKMPNPVREKAQILELVERSVEPKARPRRPYFEARPPIRSIRSVALQMTFEGDAHVPEIVGEQKFTGHHNYFLGNDESRWQSNVPLYG